MVDNISALDVNKSYNYAQYLTWRFQEQLELIRGRIYKMSPAPERNHQRISIKLLSQFLRFLDGKQCDVYHAPYDVRFSTEDGDDKNTFTVVQPDICMICDKSKLDDKGCVGAPDLIIEILSPSTAEKDAKVKFELYEEFGVKEYWMVSPTENLVDVFILNDSGKYKFQKKYVRSDEIDVKSLPGLSMKLSNVFEEE